MRLLITGFEPFGGESINPSSLAAQRLAEEGFAGVEASWLVLPVVRYRCGERVVETIERGRPEVVVMLGQAGGRMRVTPERVAINVDDFRRPDNAGNQPVDEPHLLGGPAAYFSGLPVKEMVRRMREAGVPAAVSNTAGTYLCNHVSYGVLHAIATRGWPIRAGFIHVPYVPAQAAEKELDAPSLSLDTLVRGLRAALPAALEMAALAPPTAAGVWGTSPAPVSPAGAPLAPGAGGARHTPVCR